MGRFARCSLALVCASSLAGCQWIRRSATPAAGAAMGELADLRLERKLLKEELSIVHREQSELRRLLEGGGEPQVAALAAELRATQQELTALREAATPASPPPPLLDRLAALETAVAQLHHQLQETSDEAARWRDAAQRTEEALLAVNQQLLAERGARHAAEQSLAAFSRPPAPSVEAAPTTTPPTVATAAAAGPTHTVAEGETLTSIAIDLYGDVQRWRDIYAANTTLLRGDRPLERGMQLALPAPPIAPPR